LDALRAGLRGDVSLARGIWAQYLAACRAGDSDLLTLSVEIVELARGDMVPDYEAAMLEGGPARETAIECLGKAGTNKAAEALMAFYERLQSGASEENFNDRYNVISALTPYQDDERVSLLLKAAAEDLDQPMVEAIKALSLGGVPQERLEYFESRLADPATRSIPADMVGIFCVDAIGRLAKRGYVEALPRLYAIARDRNSSPDRRKAAFRALRQMSSLSGLSQQEIQELEALK